MFSKRTSASTSSKGRTSTHTTIPGIATSKISGKSSQHTTGSPGSPDAGGSIPYIKTQDNVKVLPKYTAAINRSKDDLVPAEELDSVQLELETLLSTVALRYRVLKSEYEALDKEDKRDRKSKLSEKPPTSPGKRKRLGDKKSKDRVLAQFKMAKMKNSSAHSPAASQHTDDSMDAVLHHHHVNKDHTKNPLPKNDTPNKFWLSVEPYCMPLTNEDLKLLDDLMEDYNGPLVPPIPELGPHYSSSWAAEDIKDEQDNSNANAKGKSKSHGGQNCDVMGMIKKGEKIMGEGVTGPLTQRLVSALMEENLIPDGISNADSNSSTENTTNTSSTLRSISLMKNGISIEKRVKKELIEQGILEPDDYGKSGDDEILAEIKRVMAELTAIAEFNSGEIRKLYASAKNELKRLEIKRKLDAVDQEIIEKYNKAVAAKQKRRRLTKQERDEIFRLTEDQKKLSDQLESMPTPGYNLYGVNELK